MIEVYATQRGGKYRLFLTGHATAGEESDAVCAAVSSLVQALFLFATECDECRYLRHYLRSGEAFLSCRGGLGRGFDVVMTGLSAIAKAHPEAVAIRALHRS